ncbi:MAG: type II secretion system protein, partial [Planctomycetota bacterium]
MWDRRSILRPAAVQGARAFTIVELLVVFAIVVILIGAILVGGPRLIDKARAQTTQTLLATVDSAIEEFKREQTENPTLTAARQRDGAGGWVRYTARYGAYPPDELEVFTCKGLRGSAKASTYSLAVGRGSVFPGISSASDGYDAMVFYTDGDADPRLEHRDLAAMILAIEMFSPKAKMILDGIPAGQRSPGAIDSSTGEPGQFLDRNGDDEWTPEEDLQIRYIVD